MFVAKVECYTEMYISPGVPQRESGEELEEEVQAGAKISGFWGEGGAWGNVGKLECLPESASSAAQRIDCGVELPATGTATVGRGQTSLVKGEAGCIFEHLEVHICGKSCLLGCLLCSKAYFELYRGTCSSGQLVYHGSPISICKQYSLCDLLWPFLIFLTYVSSRCGSVTWNCPRRLKQQLPYFARSLRQRRHGVVV